MERHESLAHGCKHDKHSLVAMLLGLLFQYVEKQQYIQQQAGVQGNCTQQMHGMQKLNRH
jgi:hypothetical protein